MRKPAASSVVSAVTRDLSTRRLSTSITSLIADTNAAASRSKPPANTASRRNATRSSSSRRSWLQSSVAARVCWRSGWPRPPAGRERRAHRPSGRRAGRPRGGRHVPRRQLEGKGNAVETTTDLGNGGGSGGIEHESRRRVLRSFDEELDRLETSQPVRRRRRLRAARARAPARRSRRNARAARGSWPG